MTRKESQLLWRTIILFASSILEFESLLVLLEIILLSITYLLFNNVIDYETLYCYVLISEGFLILVLNKSAFQKKSCGVSWQTIRMKKAFTSLSVHTTIK